MTRAKIYSLYTFFSKKNCYKILFHQARKRENHEKDLMRDSRAPTSSPSRGGALSCVFGLRRRQLQRDQFPPAFTSNQHRTLATLTNKRTRTLSAQRLDDWVAVALLAAGRRRASTRLSCCADFAVRCSCSPMRRDRLSTRPCLRCSPTTTLQTHRRQHCHRRHRQHSIRCRPSADSSTQPLRDKIIKCDANPTIAHKKILAFRTSGKEINFLFAFFKVSTQKVAIVENKQRRRLERLRKLFFGALL